jgi:hypothetical protein
MVKKLCIIINIIFFLNQAYPLYASTMMPDFLCEIGIKFYQQGRYDEALLEFKKALMIKPDYEPALKYIQTITQIGLPKEEIKEFIPPAFEPTAPTRAGAIKELLDLIEIQRQMRKEAELVRPEVPTPLPEAVALPAVGTPPVKKKIIAPPHIITLDESLAKIPQPIDIEKDSSIILLGKNIQRFLVTNPNILTAEKKSADEVMLTGGDVGYTYVHVWDDKGRWTLEFLGVFPKPEGPTYEEVMRRVEERARNFRLRYSLNWASYESGRRIDKLERSSYSWAHDLTLNGETPYGDLDATTSISSLTTTTDLTYVTLGLTEGRFGPFRGFRIRGFDYSPGFSNLTFPGVSLRGAMLYSQAFNNKLDYTGFWGREGGGRYGRLSPSLSKTKDSFLEGINLNYSPNKIQNYKFTLVHGRGQDREDYLNDYGYDFSNNWNFKKWGFDYEVAYDSQSIAYLLNTHFKQPRFNLTTGLRNINKKFLTITGTGWSQGQLGLMSSLSYQPMDKLGMNSSLDVYQDTLYPAEDNDNRWNEDFNYYANYQLDPSTSLSLGYTLQNDLGKISQYRYQNPSFSISKRIRFIKDISTYAQYYHQDSKNFSSPSSDYINDRIYSGLRFNLIGQLYYYLNKELNWLQERYTGHRSQPNALETGVDWSRQFGKKPLYGTFRFTYRDEEDTVSNLSFLSGEDYIEGYAELSYRPNNDTEIYGSSRVRNIWADNPNVSKRIEASFNAGMRYVWDTGVCWEAVGNIEGYVFKDINSDGLRQKDEPPVEGIKLWLGKDKSQITDAFGYYSFKGVRARKAYVNLDVSTLPSGFVLTVPMAQEANIVHNRGVRIDFGIISRSEISGLVFEDINGNGEYDIEDKGIKGVIISLEDGTKEITDATGRYSFSNATTGGHTISLDLNSLPVYYLPKTTITKKITLFEGVTYLYNIPLKRVKE